MKLKKTTSVILVAALGISMLANAILFLRTTSSSQNTPGYEVLTKPIS